MLCFSKDPNQDGEDFVEVVNMRENSRVSTPKGFEHRFAPRKARYVRVTMLDNMDRLRLNTTDGGNGAHSDHALWADAQLTESGPKHGCRFKRQLYRES